MIQMIPEPKKLIENGERTPAFSSLLFKDTNNALPDKDMAELIRLRFWNYPDICIAGAEGPDTVTVIMEDKLPDGDVPKDKKDLYLEQGYQVSVTGDGAVIRYQGHAGLVNAVTTIKLLLEKKDGKYTLPGCEITDYPSVAVRAVAPTFSWYAGYGRFGFDCQLWGYDEWVEFMNVCLDNRINQMNMVMYGYWPFEMKDYPETVFRNVPVKIWNAENRRWLTVRYTHPNLEEPFLDRFLETAHKFDMKLFAYVGLNSYNGGYSLKHPEARMKPPAGQDFKNDFDSICLSDEKNVTYILEAMKQIARIGFDGYTLEESEEGFWFCTCEKCMKRWHAITKTPGEAKHKANLWLLQQIYDNVRAINPNAVIGIRAFRQPPLEKSPEFLQECVDTMPKDIMLFWAPGLYVPEAEFEKWAAAFGKDRIWARDTESNSITSTMGRLYRTFASNVIRYEDEPNEQVIETDIRQHRGSVKLGAHGINGFMFEWYGLFMHLFAHGNYGWGSDLPNEEFYRRACRQNFGDLGEIVLYVMKNIVTIHESQMPLYQTPFPFQKNKMGKADIPAILKAKEEAPKILDMISTLQAACDRDEHLAPWRTHFDKLKNAERRNQVIYDMMLAAIAYEDEEDPDRKEELLQEILDYNEKDFAIAKEMFFDINPVTETGIASCMFPYHEIKREIYNIHHPDHPDTDVISSGVEAFGWLWL